MDGTPERDLRPRSARSRTSLPDKIEDLCGQIGIGWCHAVCRRVCHGGPFVWLGSVELRRGRRASTGTRPGAVLNGARKDGLLSCTYIILEQLFAVKAVKHRNAAGGMGLPAAFRRRTGRPYPPCGVAVFACICHLKWPNTKARQRLRYPASMPSTVLMGRILRIARRSSYSAPPSGCGHLQDGGWVESAALGMPL